MMAITTNSSIKVNALQVPGKGGRDPGLGVAFPFAGFWTRFDVIAPSKLKTDPPLPLMNTQGFIPLLLEEPAV